jgi:hypothetical protein
MAVNVGPIEDEMPSRPSDSTALEEIERSTCSDTGPRLKQGMSDISSWDGSVLDPGRDILSGSDDRKTTQPVDDGMDDVSDAGAISKDDNIPMDGDDRCSNHGECVGGATAEECVASQLSIARPSAFDEDVRVLVASTPP